MLNLRKALETVPNMERPIGTNNFRLTLAVQIKVTEKDIYGAVSKEGFCRQFDDKIKTANASITNALIEKSREVWEAVLKLPEE